VVQIVKFASNWIIFEHEGKCYSINSENEFDYQQLSEIARMSFDEVKKKYNLECDSDDNKSSCCSCC